MTKNSGPTFCALLILWLSTSGLAQSPVVGPSVRLQPHLPASVRAQQMKGEARGVRDSSRQQNATPREQSTVKPPANSNSDKASTPQIYREAAEGRTEVVLRALESEPALITQKDSSGYLLLHHAAYGGQLELVKTLLEKQGRVDSIAARGETPLFLAASRGHQEVVKYLALNGADVDRAASDGKTPLHKAALDGHAEVVDVLLEAGADPNIKDRSGRTAQEIAERYRQGDSQRVIRSLQNATP